MSLNRYDSLNEVKSSTLTGLRGVQDFNGERKLSVSVHNMDPENWNFLFIFYLYQPDFVITLSLLAWLYLSWEPRQRA